MVGNVKMHQDHISGSAFGATCLQNSRLKKSNEMQQYADIYFPLKYSTCFGRPSRPTSGVYKTVVAASGIDHTTWGASFKPETCRVI